MACAPSEDSDQISLGIYPVRSESSLCAQWVAKDPSFLHTDSKDSDQSGRLADLSLCWAHMPFCWFCHEVAHFKNKFFPYDPVLLCSL